MRQGFTKRGIRKSKGSAIAETGPAMLILFMFLFFPLVNCLAMGVSYASCLTLNDVQCREAATLPKNKAVDAAGLIKHTLVEQWSHSGLGAFVQTVNTPQTQLSYFDGATDSTGTEDQYVEITTAITARPFMQMPFFVPVPGMSAPVTFTISNRRMVENHHFNQ